MIYSDTNSLWLEGSYRKPPEENHVAGAADRDTERKRLSFFRESQSDILKYVLIEATHMYKEVAPNLLKFINLGLLIHVKTLKCCNILL